MTIPHFERDFIPLSTMPKYTTKSACPPKAPSLTNVNSFPVEGWMTTTCPTMSVVPGRIGKILGYEDYYFKSERILCTRAFSVAAISTTVDKGESLRREREGQLEDSLTTGNCELLGLSKPNASGAKLSLLDLLENRESLGKFDDFLNGFWLF
jgi:hypothetical protein